MSLVIWESAGSLMAHHYRQKTGKGQHVDVSMQASMLWALANAPSFWSLNRENLHRAGALIIGRSIKGAKMTAIYPCRDGHINFIIYGGEAGKRSNEGMVAWMAEHGGAPDWLKQKNWDEFNVATATQAEIDTLEEPFGAFLAGRTKAEFATESVKRGILGYPVNNVRDIRQDPQLVARDFWTEVEHPELENTITYPGAFAKFSCEDGCIRRRAPQIGEHNREIYLDELNLTQAEYAALEQAHTECALQVADLVPQVRGHVAGLRPDVRHPLGGPGAGVQEPSRLRLLADLAGVIGNVRRGGHGLDQI